MQIKTELPEIFTEFDEARRQGFIQVKELKEQGIPVIGVYCTFMPEEIVLAANAVQISLCSTSDETIAAAEEDLPRNLCPLIKSSYGFGKTDKCPFFYFSDLVVGETTCDGKKKMYEYMEEFKPLYLMQLPNMRNSAASFNLWKDEIVRFKEKLEEFLDVEITEEQIRQAIRLKNREREARKNFYGLGKLNPPAIEGSEIFKVMYGANYTFEKEGLIEKLTTTTNTIQDQYLEKHQPQGKPRILITGSPMGGVTEKVIRAVEENGGTIVGFENCTVAKAVEKLVDEEKEDVYEALAEKYIDIGCACMSNNTSRFDLLDRMIDEYQVDGVLDMVLQSCHPYSIESLKVRRFCQEEKNVPYLYLETDYSTADIEQINTRVTAFIEMLEE
ncbi:MULTISPECIES: double-cubane-cluster-containing anaerobic reductase [unclassified Enterococcus]|uniref:double-cubane-cluster-containing anaerobic reductase n=1 Tax=unclassified Enterococcus TaxID=2608891 RepID=UPI001CE06C82|nr:MULTISPECIES: double-cubane-cluster-containing anaerobic reductase [unclassified Enterococcus]MCA5011902.1 2-hydroxyacyl-CoA dehydratase [Enterococcus sp. S23]MCA5014656.1 2-hydroxyacyl-CoA dehydratase [Enterococcus sp. S22(2020)]